MKIKVDFREEPSGIPALIKEKDMKVVMEKLSYGDYVVNGSVTIERKTGNDFLVSLIDGRLFKQVSNLKKYCENPILLIEGNPYKTDLNVKRNAIRGAILSIQTSWYLPVVYSRCKEETRDILMTISEQDSNRKEELVLRHGYRPKRLKSKQLYILQGLPHVGPVLAQRLLKHFGSVKEVMCASEDDFQMVEGIGNGLAKKIVAVLK